MNAPPLVNVCVLCRGEERYIVLYAATRYHDALRQLSRWACNDELEFDWRDAANMASRMGKEREHERDKHGLCDD